jgi:hypothetical protein
VDKELLIAAFPPLHLEYYRRGYWRAVALTVRVLIMLGA